MPRRTGKFHFLILPHFDPILNLASTLHLFHHADHGCHDGLSVAERPPRGGLLKGRLPKRTPPISILFSELFDLQLPEGSWGIGNPKTWLKGLVDHPKSTGYGNCYTSLILGRKNKSQLLGPIAWRGGQSGISRSCWSPWKGLGLDGFQRQRHRAYDHLSARQHHRCCFHQQRNGQWQINGMQAAEASKSRKRRQAQPYQKRKREKSVSKQQSRCNRGQTRSPVAKKTVTFK